MALRKPRSEDSGDNGLFVEEEEGEMAGVEDGRGLDVGDGLAESRGEDGGCLGRFVGGERGFRELEDRSTRSSDLSVVVGLADGRDDDGVWI